MTRGQKKPLTTIYRLEEIPAFGREVDEHAFWATHELSDALWDQAEPLAPEELPPPRPATITVVIQLDEPTLRRVKALARRRRKGYQVLLSKLVAERLDEEERHMDRRRPPPSSAG